MSGLIAILAASLVLSGQTPEPTPPDSTAAISLEDVEVTGRRLDDLIGDFVGKVAAPNQGRGLARWKDYVCVGAVQFERETAEYLTDRVSTVASDLGLRVGGEGCRPNIILIGTHRPDEIASQMVSDKRRYFRPGGSGMDQGRKALETFQSSDRPVRWWQVSHPVDSHTGLRAYRIPGECGNNCETALDYAPIIFVSSASNLSTQIVDDLQTAMVIVDASKLEGIGINQLADYVAMVSLAQIDPEADTTGYISILNVFDDPASTSALTNWDIAYLTGMYGAKRTRLNPGAARQEIASSIRRAHRTLASDTPDTD